MDTDTLTRYNDLAPDRIMRWIKAIREEAGGVRVPMPIPTPHVRLEGVEAVDGADLLPTVFGRFVARRLAESSAFLRCRPRMVRISPEASSVEVPYITSDGRLEGGIGTAAATITITPASSTARPVSHFDRRRESFTDYITQASATVAATASDPDATVTLDPVDGQVSGLTVGGPTKAVTVTISNATTGASATYTVNVGRRSAAEAGDPGPVRPLRLAASPAFGSAKLDAIRGDFATTPASNVLVRDAGIDAVAHIAGILGRLLARDFDRAAIRTGSGGVGEPAALFKDEHLTAVTGGNGVAGVPTTANLETMVETLDPHALNMAHDVPADAGGVADIDADLMSFDASPPTWLANPDTALTVRQLETTTGSGVRWWDAGWPLYLAEMPMVRSDDVPAAAADTTSAILGHFPTSVLCRVPAEMAVRVTNRGPGFSSDQTYIGVRWSADTVIFDRTNLIAFVGGGS